MSVRRYRTMGDLRDELARRLGFGAQVGNLGDLDETLKSFLRTAQTNLWWALDWTQLRRELIRSTGVGQEQFDYPPDCEPGKIYGLEIQRDSWWSCLVERDAEQDLAVNVDALPANTWTEALHGPDKSERGIPATYQRAAQHLLLWPVSDRPYAIKLVYQAYPSRFSADTDRSTLPDELVLSRAIADGKAHYNHADVGRYDQEFQTLLMRLRAAEHGQRRYVQQDPMRRIGNQWDEPVRLSQMGIGP